MNLRKGRIALLILATLVVWLVSIVIIQWALLSNYTYSMERVNPATGASEPIYQPGEQEARTTAARAELVLMFGLIAALAVVVVKGSRPGHWLRNSVEPAPQSLNSSG